MYYWERSSVNDRLRLAKFQSYRIIPATPSGRISSEYIIELLNRTGVGVSFRLDVPSDLLTPEELIALYADSHLTWKNLRKWMHRKRRPIPHYRLSRYAIRFSASDVESWLKETSVA